MPEIDMEMVAMLQSFNVTGNIVELADKVRPSERQYALVPGDKCILATTHLTKSYGLFGDMAHLVELMDPEEYKLTFPDYEERLQKGFLLGLWSNQFQPQGELGWFGRIELMKLPEDREKEMLDWIESGLPDDMPEWLHKALVEFYQEVAETSPDAVARPAACPKCESRNTHAHIDMRFTIHVGIGEVPKPGTSKMTYMSISDKAVQRYATIELHCDDCEESTTISPVDFELDGNQITPYRRIIEMGDPLE